MQQPVERQPESATSAERRSLASEPLLVAMSVGRQDAWAVSCQRARLTELAYLTEQTGQRKRHFALLNLANLFLDHGYLQLKLYAMPSARSTRSLHAPPAPTH
jgi:hypothetical protein